MEKGSWRFVFDSSDGQSVVQHALSGVLHWQISGLRDGIGVMETALIPIPDALPPSIAERGLLRRAIGLVEQADDTLLLPHLARLRGAIIYTIETVCAESIDVICAEVSEQVIVGRDHR